MMCASTSSSIARHTDGVAHALLPVDGELLGQDVHDAPLRRNAHRTRGVDRTMHVLVSNLAMTGFHGDDAPAVLGGDVAPRDPDHSGVDGNARHLLGHVDRLGHGLRSAVDLDDRSLAHPPRRDHADAQDSETGGLKICDSAADFGRSEIECEDAARTSHCLGLRV